MNKKSALAGIVALFVGVGIVQASASAAAVVAFDCSNGQSSVEVIGEQTAPRGFSTDDLYKTCAAPSSENERSIFYTC